MKLDDNALTEDEYQELMQTMIKSHWHLRHDEEVWWGNRCVAGTTDKALAEHIVALQAKHLSGQDDPVIAMAKRLVSHEESSQGYGDVGRVLVDYLSGETSAEEATGIFQYLDEGYEAQRLLDRRMAALADKFARKDKS